LELLGLEKLASKMNILQPQERNIIFAMQVPGLGHDGYLSTCWGLKPLEKMF